MVESPGEAEAQCAWLTKVGLADAVIGEDYDTLAFGGTSLIRNFSRGEASMEIDREALIDALEISEEQFLDFCILCGCDYLPKISGIGPVKALKFIKENGNLEGVVEHLMGSEKLRRKHPVPDDFNYLIARRLFTHPEVVEVKEEEVRESPCQEEELEKFLLEREFDEKRISRWIEKMRYFTERAAHL